MSITPACLNKTTSPFVKSDGSLFPCCWASTNPDIMKFLDKEKYSQLNLYHHTVDEIYSSDAYKLIKSKILSENPFAMCKLWCSTTRKLERQDGSVDSSEIDDYINKYIRL
jgi:hypothetical protein